MENQKGQNQDAGKKVWTTPKLEVLSQKGTLGGDLYATEGIDGYVS